MAACSTDADTAHPHPRGLLCRAPCSRTARRLFWYLLACAIGVVLVRWLQSIEGVGMMWVFLSAVSEGSALRLVPRRLLCCCTSSRLMSKNAAMAAGRLRHSCTSSTVPCLPLDPWTCRSWLPP